MTATTQPNRRGASRYVPTLIVVLFLAPMAAAWLAFHYFPEQMRDLGTTNFGDFIQPPKEVSVSGLTDLDGVALEADFFKDKWTYLYVDGSACDALCQATLFEMRQVRLAQGAEMDRVQRLFVLTDTEQLNELRALLEREYARQRTVVANTEAQAALREALSLDQDGAPLAARRVYVIDPLGRAMMYYEPVASAERSEVLAQATGMRKDMAKLLKNSKTQ